MEQKNNSNWKKNLLVVVFVIAVAYPLGYIANQYVTINKLEAESERLNKDLSDILLNETQLKNDIESSKSESFIEKMARENLKMVKKGEIVYIKVD